MIDGSKDGVLLLQMKIAQFLNQYWEGECEGGVLLCVPDNIDKLLIDFLFEEPND